MLLKHRLTQTVVVRRQYSIWTRWSDAIQKKKLSIDQEMHKISPPSQSAGLQSIPGVKSIIAVSSIKGGVGKSTISVNLALALQKQGVNVGILDADVYRPSLPRLINLDGVKLHSTYDEKTDTEYFLPLVNYNIKCMSMGFLAQKQDAIDWYSEIAIRIGIDMFDNVRWGEPDLDVLIIDFAPGASDVQLETLSRVPIRGAIMVTTPQENSVSTEDIKKEMELFSSFQIPIFGLIENMYEFKCSGCGHKEEIFGSGGGKSLANQFNVDLLGQIPLNRSISDQKVPLVIRDPSSPGSFLFNSIAEKVKAKLESRTLSNQ